jgi:amino acid transporter
MVAVAEETVVFARKASGLVREMTWWDVVLITLAGPAGAGMLYYAVKVPGMFPGGNAALAYFLGGLIWALPIFLVAVFASSFPRSGAIYVVISRAVHPIVGFLPNWMWVVSGGLTAGFVNYLGLYLIAAALQTAGIIGHSAGLTKAGDWLADGNYQKLWIAILLTLLLWGAQLLGMHRLKWFIRAIIYVPLAASLIATVLFFVTDGSSTWDAVYGAGVHDKVMALAQAQGIKEATLPLGAAMSGMFLAVFAAYSAAESVSFVGSEVKRPRTSYLRGVVLGYCILMALYVVSAWAPGVSFGSTFPRDYSWLYYYHSDGLEEVLGATPSPPSIPFYAGIATGSAWTAIALAVAFLGWYLNTSIVVWVASVRGIFAMAFDRQLPLGLCRVSKSGVPTTATHLVGVLGLIGCFLGLGDASGAQVAAVMLAILDLLAMFFIWTVGLAAMLLPFTRPDLYEKSTFQHTLGRIPVLSIFGSIVLGIGWYIAFVVGLELTTTYSQIAIAAIMTLGLVLVAFMYGRNRREGIDPTLIYAQIPPA